MGQSDKIGQMISNTENLEKEIVGLKEKLSNPMGLVSDNLGSITDNVSNLFGRRLDEENVDGLLASVQKKIAEGKTNQQNIKTALKAADGGLRTLEDAKSLFDGEGNWWAKLKSFFKNLFGQTKENRRLKAFHDMRHLKEDHYAAKNVGDNREIIHMFCQEDNIKKLNHFARMSLEFMDRNPMHKSTP